jgi:hypothetical protein
MSWTTSTTELRTLLSDGATDKLRYRKRVFGMQDGTNKVFQTFEFRRLTNFTTATAPSGVYVNGVIQTVDTDFTEVGEFKLHTAPANTDTVEATYYNQWFLDAELDQFCSNGGNWLGFSDKTVTPVGLQPSLIRYAAADAYEKLALRYAEHVSERFRLEDAPDPKLRTPVVQYMDMAKNYREEATKQRDQYYTRQGQSLQPLFNTVTGTVKNQTPRT